MVGNPDFLTGQGTDSPEFQELETPEGEIHLRFYIPSRHEFALPAIGIREVVASVPERITPIPNVSPLLLGTLNFRGQVIWVADLGQFLGESVPLNTDRAEIQVIAVEDQDTILGLAIDEINKIDWLPEDQLQTATHLTDGMAPFVRGEWLLGENGDQCLLLLDQVAILRSARWAA